jgi:hypothetical protein
MDTLTPSEAETVAAMLTEEADRLAEYASSRSLTRSWSGNYTPGPDETQASREASELRAIVAKLIGPGPLVIRATPPAEVAAWKVNA